MTAGRYLDDFKRDLIYAVRALRSTPAFTVSAVLALAIGANSAIFTVVYAVLLKPLPYPEAGRVVRFSMIGPADPATGRPVRVADLSMAEAQEIRARTMTVSHLALTGGPAIVTMAGHGPATRLQGVRVSWELFETLGVQPLVGRAFGAAEAAPGSGPAIVLSHRGSGISTRIPE